MKVISVGHRLKLLRLKMIKDKDKNKNKEMSTIEYPQHNQEEEEGPYNNNNKNDCKFEMDDIIEMARVEGYDDSSYVVSSLKDIAKRLSNNELKIASSKIDKVLSDVMPFDYQQFFELFKATEDTAERLRNKVCWVLLGPTGINMHRYIYIH